MPLDPHRTVAELRELRELTGDEDGAQRVAWTDTWARAREWLQGRLDGLPLDLTAEVHVKADRGGIELRRILSDLVDVDLREAP